MPVYVPEVRPDGTAMVILGVQVAVLFPVIAEAATIVNDVKRLVASYSVRVTVPVFAGRPAVYEKSAADMTVPSLCINCEATADANHAPPAVEPRRSVTVTAPKSTVAVEGEATEPKVAVAGAEIDIPPPAIISVREVVAA